ncbi:hypothetical protein [Pseudomonas aeruginosa]|uniref:hypothetical protein n=1 Tax=Pseudomonas aeruginosa TaxID=287 RepID=UPI0019237F83|nr:hypothetical protein [Pseudomonas aeruginosa]
MNKESVEQSGGDERAAFEAWLAQAMSHHFDPDLDLAKYEDSGEYRYNPAADYWKAWQARAALAQPSPAQAEAERPEVAEVAFVLRNIGAMDAEDIDGDNVDLRFEDAEGRDTGCDVSIVEYAEKAADLFEQHARIVGALRADRDSWAEQAEQRLADWDEMRKERDAALAEVERLRESKGDPVGSLEKCMKVMYERDEHAKRLEVALARVAELEGKLTDWVHEGFRLNEALAMASDAASKGDAARHAACGMEMEIQELKAKLAELEKQEPLLHINPLVVDELLGRAKRSPGGLTWSKGRCGSWTLPLYAAPVAQAQHSVPGDIMRDAQRYRWLRDQQFYFSFSTENSDAGISSCTAGMSSRFKNLSWVDAAIDSAIAAAPGKEGV